MTSEAALAKAVESGLDLVEVAPGSKPPVVRIMDYGRYKYEQKKKAAAGKAKGKAGAGNRHREAARDLLGRLSSHLPHTARELFWRNNAVARKYWELVGP